MKNWHLNINNPTIIVQAEDFGFGPTSLALSIVEKLIQKRLKNHEIVFVGSGVSMQLAKLSHYFNRYISFNITDENEMETKRHLFGDVKLFISVVSPMGAKLSLKQGFKTAYVDPLFWFFNHIDSDLEKVEYYFVQKFEDTEIHQQRLNFTHSNLISTEWITRGIPSLSVLKKLMPLFCKEKSERELFKSFLFDKEKEFILINFGGVDNFLSETSIYPEK